MHVTKWEIRSAECYKVYSTVHDTHRGIILHTNCCAKEIFVKPLYVVLTNKNIRTQLTHTGQEMIYTAINTLGRVLLSETQVHNRQPEQLIGVKRQ